MIAKARIEDLLGLCAQVRDQYPMIGGGLIDKHLRPDDPLWDYALLALGYVIGRAHTEEDVDRVVEAFATVSLDFLRLQARFMKTGRYAAESSESLVTDLYDDEAKMKGYYLDGLAMTYALWPNHTRMLAFYSSEFLANLAPGSRILEVGLGHGLLTAVLFDRVPNITYVGADISRSALDYAALALSGLGVEQSRARLVLANAVDADLETLSEGRGFDAMICCEVIEHVSSPSRLMSNLARSVAPGAPAFVSTVANMEAEDHVFLFEDVSAIRRLLETTGWTIANDLDSVLPGAEEWDPLPVNYSAIINRALVD